MSKFYGTLESDKGVSTRAGHQRIRASAQSHDGSVSVEIFHGIVIIDVAPNSNTGGRQLLRTSLEKLLQAEGLALKKAKRKEG